MRSCESKMPERAALRYHTHFLFTPTKCHTAERREAAEQLLLSEKATCERIKKRGPHHPPTRNSILLRVGAIQRAQGVDEVSVNMECNARLRDSWGPHTPQDPLRSDTQALKKSLHTQICPPQHAHHRRAKTCVPILKRGASQSVTHNTDATTAPDTTRRHRNCIFSRETQPRTANTRRMIKTAGTKERPPAPESMLTRSLPNLKYDIKTGASLPKLNSFGPAQRAGLTQAGRQRPSREGAHSGYQQMI
ncbi:hypothetical protein INR49_029445 [Caranx melampygus]|nr:hypothetical protein INR49_029445 [Caranx melampygus]